MAAATINRANAHNQPLEGEHTMAYVIFWIICGVIAYAAAGKNQKGLAIALGLLLGPIGILIAALTNKDEQESRDELIGSLRQDGDADGRAFPSK